VTVDPNTTGAGSVTSIDATPPNGSKNPRSIALKAAKGFKYDGRAAPKRCSDAQGKQNNCPAGSRVGGGTVDVTATPGGHVIVDLGLFLGPKRKPGDLTGVVGIAKVRATGQKGHAFGRVFRIDEGKLGIETLFSGLDKALKPPEGFKVHVDRLRLHFGRHRQVNGKRVDLIRNPGTCGAKGWAYAAVVTYPDGSGKTFRGAAQCTQ
jgi:hypothetical protein